MAAQNSKIDKSIIELLIEKGVDLTCQDEVTCFYLKIKFLNIKFRTERGLIKWQKVKSELSFDSIMYIIIVICLPYLIIVVGRRPIFSH